MDSARGRVVYSTLFNHAGTNTLVVRRGTGQALTRRRLARSAPAASPAPANDAGSGIGTCGGISGVEPKRTATLSIGSPSSSMFENVSQKLGKNVRNPAKSGSTMLGIP